MKNIWKYIFGIYIFILMLISLAAYYRVIPNEVNRFPHFDVVMHFLLLGGASYFAHRALNRKYIFKYLPSGPLFILFIAIVEEFTQTFSDVRTFCYIDLFANISGIVLFYLFDLIFLIARTKK